MPHAAEPRPGLSDPVPLTAQALDQLDEQVAHADARECSNRQHKPGALHPDLQGLMRPPHTVTSSKVPETGGTRVASLNESKAATTTSTSQTHAHNIHLTSELSPNILLQNPAASSSHMTTDYIVDGIIYRSPDTLGTLIEVGAAPGKGLAVFALRDILPGTLLLSERPLIKLNDDGSRADPLDGLVNALAPALKKAYRSLHGYQEVPAVAAVPPPSLNPSSASTPPPRKRRAHAAPLRQSLNRRVLYSNGFGIGTTTSGVFALASRINHSCVPNASFSWNEETGRMDYVAEAKLLEGEEVTIDYGHKKGHLKKYYGFECDCGACTEWGSVSATTVEVEDANGVVGEVGEGGEVPVVYAEKDGFGPIRLVKVGDIADGEQKVGGGEMEEKENLTPEIQGV